MAATPYGRSKLAVEWMLADAARAHAMRYVALRYFNVAGADPKGRLGQSAPNATHLIRRTVQTALGQHARLEIFGRDYPTPDGTCLRDYIHVSDLIDAHRAALAYLRAGGASLECNAGYGRGYSVQDVIDVVKRVANVDFQVNIANRRPGDLAAVIANPKLIARALGWRPKRDGLDLIVRHTLDWEHGLINKSWATRPAVTT
ncbi:NAD-dependent epimerase/dehydratase family protein [Bradyrhizobium erythrophlei]|uniref:NAD-dependent epimerase/dehydratase family protein n=1 Tax=Bradyrhizobium erythrophlei TaxID=1437360 RepID=UPI0035E4F42A